MRYGGIDFGNGFTKVCFDDHTECFPSLVAKSYNTKWGQGEISVGYDAARDAQNIGSCSITHHTWNSNTQRRISSFSKKGSRANCYIGSRIFSMCRITI
jgi:hypothetical protein